MGNWSYNPVGARLYQISSEPDFPCVPPIRDNLMSTTTRLTLNIFRLMGMSSGMEDLIWYEIFMKNVTNGDSDFSLSKTLNGTIPT